MGRRSRRRASACQAPEARALLLPYVQSACTDDDAVTFEAHLLGCAACFRDLKLLDRAGSLLREFLGPERPSVA